MRAAPAVDATLGDGRRERVLVSLAYGLAGATVLAWALSHAEVPLAAWPVLAGGAAALLGWFVWPTPPGRLRWTGQFWTLGDDRPLRSVSVQIDAGGWMLLRMRPQDGRARWAGVGAAQAGASWHGLRVALAFHAGAAPSLEQRHVA